MTVRKFLKSEDVAEMLNVTPGSLANDRYRGEGIPYVKIGTRVRYLESDVLAYIEANRVVPQPPAKQPGRTAKTKGHPATDRNS